MKIAPVSADLLFKVALVAVAAGVVVWAVRKASSAASDAVSNVGQAINPINPNNAIYATANQVWGGVTGTDPDRPIGSRIYDFFHGDELKQPSMESRMLL